MFLEAISLILPLVLGAVLLAGLFLTPVALALLLRGLYRALVRLARWPSRGAWEYAVGVLGFLDAGDRVMAGRLRGFEVRIEELWLGVLRRGVRGSVDCEGTLPPDFEVSRRSLPFAAAWGVDVGDPELLRAFHVDGPLAVALSALGWGARQALLDTCAIGSLRVCRSTVSLDVHGTADRLPAVAELLVRAAEALSGAKTPARTLAAAVQSEPLDTVRLACLEALVREYPDRPECARACEAALEDVSPLLRLEAAAVVGGDRGFGVLERLVDARELSTALRASALDALPRSCNPVPREGLVARQLGSDEPLVRTAAVRAIARLGLVSLLEPLRALGCSGDPACQEEAAGAMGVLGDPRAEPTLVSMLVRARRQTQLAAVDALAKMGTRAAIAPLTVLAETSAGPLSSRARAAIHRVQGRLGEASAGQLSVVADERPVGALSLPAAAGGELSLLARAKA